jgi:hypothetical protein
VGLELLEGQPPDPAGLDLLHERSSSSPSFCSYRATGGD